MEWTCSYPFGMHKVDLIMEVKNGQRSLSSGHIFALVIMALATSAAAIELMANIRLKDSNLSLHAQNPGQ